MQLERGNGAAEHIASEQIIYRIFYDESTTQ